MLKLNEMATAAIMASITPTMALPLNIFHPAQGVLSQYSTNSEKVAPGATRIVKHNNVGGSSARRKVVIVIILI